MAVDLRADAARRTQAQEVIVNFPIAERVLFAPRFEITAPWRIDREQYRAMIQAVDVAWRAHRKAAHACVAETGKPMQLSPETVVSQVCGEHPEFDAEQLRRCFDIYEIDGTGEWIERSAEIVVNGAVRRVWLNPIPPELHEQAINSLQRRDPFFIHIAKSAYSVSLVYWNAPLLKELGMYEETLLDAITACKSNNRGWPLSVLKYLIEYADRDRLRAAGDPLHGPGPYTLHRGVAGSGKDRRIRGISWTANFHRAVWFAARAGLSDPAVYSATVDKRYIVARLHERYRHEDEYVVLLPNSVRLTCMPVTRKMANEADRRLLREQEQRNTNPPAPKEAA